MALNDEDVDKEMKKMVAFIRQEAQEKAREIKVKADEEFNIEKAKLVRQEVSAIEALYEKKMKQAQVQKKIALSAHSNKARLKTLELKQQLLDELFAETRNKLVEKVGKMSEAQYQELLRELVLQGIFRLMEEVVSVQCREKDSALVKKAAEDAVKACPNAFGVKVTASIGSEFLPEKSGGGVIVSGLNGRITCCNTMESRLELLFDQMLPSMRVMLFGVSESRKFYN